MADEENGQAPALATKGKARAAGKLEVIRGGKNAEKAPAPKRGLRIEEDKDFQYSEDHDATGIVRVFDTDPNNSKEDVVLFSGSRKQLQKVVEQGQKFLKK